MDNEEKRRDAKGRQGFTAAQLDQFRKESPLADAYENPLPGIRLFHRQRIRAILELLGEAFRFRDSANHAAARVVEFGCGDGFLVEQVAAAFPAAGVYALDISHTALLRARRRASAGRLIQSDAGTTPLAGNAFAVALCSEVLEHVPNDDGLLREIFRVLSPGGCLVLTTPNLYTVRNLLRKLIGREPKIEIVEHLREYSYGEASAKLEAAGFNILRFRSVGFHIPKMHRIFRRRLLSGTVFSLARIWPTRGRDFMFLARKPA